MCLHHPAGRCPLLVNALHPCCDWFAPPSAALQAAASRSQLQILTLNHNQLNGE